MIIARSAAGTAVVIALLALSVSQVAGQRALRGAAPRFINGRPDTVLVWGPKHYVRGSSGTWTYFPESLNIATYDSTKRYTLRITNGTSAGANRVSEMSFTLNGYAQMSPSDVTTTIHKAVKVVKPKALNAVTTGVRGTAGSYVDVDVIATPNPAYNLTGPSTYSYWYEDPEIQPLYQQYTQTFTRPAAAAGPWMLEMTNGDSTGAQRCSATLTLNGTQIVAAGKFTPSIASLSKQVTLLSGTNTYVVRVHAGNNGDQLTLRFTATDTTAPVIQLKSPAADTAITATFLALAGNVTDETGGKILRNGSSIGDGPGAFKDTLQLAADGWATYTVEMTNSAGYRTAVTRQVLRDTQGPALIVTNPAHNTQTSATTINVTGLWSCVASTRVLINGKLISPIGTSGSFTEPVPLALGANLISVVARDTAGHERREFRNVIREPMGAGAQEPILPALPLTQLTPFKDQVRGLWQLTGADSTQLEPARTAVIRGRVIQASGTNDTLPLPHVTVKVVGHPEYGTATSRQSGHFDLVVNGGGELTLEFTRGGFLRAQRVVSVPWQDHVHAGVVALKGYDLRQTEVSQNASGVQAVRGSVVQEDDLRRQATMLLDPGTNAQKVLPDGSTAPLPGGSFRIRATEYTVGPLGRAAMPSELPTFSGYTYCVDLSVVEADSVGAQGVVFDKPVNFYLENFMGVPVGGGCPTGRYDPIARRWVALPAGRVLKVVGESLGVAVISLDPAGTPATPSERLALGLDVQELTTLRGLYPVGQTLWRVQLNHFSSVDINWAFRLPSDATAPTGGDPHRADKPINDCCEEDGASVIDIENRTLRETLPLTGTEARLHYSSERTRGNLDASTVRIPLKGQNVPPSMVNVHVIVDVAGQRAQWRYFSGVPTGTGVPAEVVWTWDGRDGYGRRVQGPRVATIQVGYEYPNVGVSSDPTNSFSFGAPERNLAVWSVTANRSNGIVWATSKVTLGAVTNHVTGVGGWSLTPHHFYDFSGKGTLYLGDGRRMNGERQNPSLLQVVGTAGEWASDEEGAALSVSVIPTQLSMGPDGNCYFIDHGNSRIARLTPAGSVERICGGSNNSNTGEDVPASIASIQPGGLEFQSDIAVGPDSAVYLAEGANHRIRRIYWDGTIYRIRTIAGSSQTADTTGNGGPASAATFHTPSGIAVANDGTIYVYDRAFGQIRRISRDGIVTKVGGTVLGYGGDGGPALLAGFGNPANASSGRMAIGLDGSLLLADQTNDRIRRIAPDGMVTSIAAIASPRSLSVGREGEIYVVTNDERIVRLDASGAVSTVAGVSQPGGAPLSHEHAWTDYSLSGLAKFRVLRDVATGPDGRLVFSEQSRDPTLPNNIGDWSGLGAILSVAPGFSPAEVVVAAESGAEQHVFDPNGRHLRTIDATTGSVRYRFEYDSTGGKAGLLRYIRDFDDNVVEIQRQSDGTPTAIIAPFGQSTALTTVADTEGAPLLRTVTNPRSDTYTITTNTSTGQMSSLQDPRGYTTNFTMTAAGKLAVDQAPDGQQFTLTLPNPVPSDTARTVRVTSAMNRVSEHYVTFDRIQSREFRTSRDAANLVRATDRDGVERVYSEAPDGMQTRSIPRPDARPGFAMQSPVADSLEIRRPSGTSLRLHVAQNGAMPYGALTFTTRVNGRATSVAYAPSGATRALVVTPPTGSGRAVTRYVDAMGRDSVVALPGLAPISVHRLANGLTDRVTLGTRQWHYLYDASGRLARVLDPLGRSSAFSYDAADRVAAQILPSAASEDSVVAYAYDANGNLTSVQPPGRPAHTFAYTPGNLARHYDPPLAIGRDTTGYAYNLDRQLTTIVRPDTQTIALGYHPSTGRLETVSQAGVTSTLGYASTGNLASIARDGADATALAYGYDGAVLSSEAWTGAVTGTVGLTYDANLWPDVQTVSVGGTSVAADYDYDLDGLLDQVTLPTGLYDVLRQPNGLLSGTTLGAVTTSQGYNAYGEVMSAAAALPGGALYVASYGRDSLGRIVQHDETVRGVRRTRRYQYDPRGRLGVVRDSAGSELERYTYDRNGNRLSAALGGGPAALSTYDAQDRLLSSGDGAVSYGYTGNGERRTRTGGGAPHTLTYDALGNLLRVDLGSGGPVEYVVDGRNRRVARKVAGTVSQRWLYQNGLAAAAELDGSGALKKRFVYASRSHVPDVMVVKQPSGADSVYRLVSDHLGSVRLVVNAASGWVAQELQYDAWGNVTLDTNPGLTPFGFAGGLYDPATALVRFGARDYEPASGRWLARDPVGFAGGSANLQAYTDADPVNLIDPSGAKSVQEQLDEFAGFFDALTFGWASRIRQRYFGYNNIDLNSAACGSGRESGNGVVLSLSLGGIGRVGGVAGRALSREIGILRDASRGKGNFGLGGATRAEAESIGRAWVGSGYKTASDGRTLLSSDGLRQFRPPAFKPGLGSEQANFERRLEPTGRWLGNGHLDIVP